MVPLRKNVKQYTRAVHRLVADAFLHAAGAGYVPVHCNGNRQDNRVENLDWKTLSQAREMTDTMSRTTPRDDRPVYAVDLQQEFANALEAARAVGGIERHILNAAYNTHLSYKRTRWEFIR